MTRSHRRLGASSASGRKDGPATSTKERIIDAVFAIAPPRLRDVAGAVTVRLGAGK
jgi:hypothetical protein